MALLPDLPDAELVLHGILEQTQTWDWRRHNDFSTGELKRSRNKKIKRERERERERT